MEPIDINSQTRADCHGMRPDLYAMLSGNMVRKEDISAIDMSSGYIVASRRDGPTVPSGGRWDMEGFEASTAIKNARLETFTNGVGGDGQRIVFEETGMWLINFNCSAFNRGGNNSAATLMASAGDGASFPMMFSGAENNSPLEHRTIVNSGGRAHTLANSGVCVVDQTGGWVSLSAQSLDNPTEFTTIIISAVKVA